MAGPRSYPRASHPTGSSQLLHGASKSRQPFGGAQRYLVPQSSVVSSPREAARESPRSSTISRTALGQTVNPLIAKLSCENSRPAFLPRKMSPEPQNSHWVGSSAIFSRSATFGRNGPFRPVGHLHQCLCLDLSCFGDLTGTLREGATCILAFCGSRIKKGGADR